MLPDYEIKRTVPIIERLMPYIEFILILFVIQSSIMLFTNDAAEDETIRFRLLAHSNAPADQQIKEDIRREIEPLINEAIATSASVEELGDNFEALEETIITIASAMTNGMPVKLERTDALFPAKRSGFIISPQANYDAYILTIGSGRGDNWWCSLFPKICFQDEEVVEEAIEVEDDGKVTFFIWEWIKDLFN